MDRIASNFIQHDDDEFIVVDERNENESIIQKLIAQNEMLISKISFLDQQIIDLKSENINLKTDVNNLRTDIGDLRTDMGDLRIRDSIYVSKMVSLEEEMRKRNETCEACCRQSYVKNEICEAKVVALDRQVVDMGDVCEEKIMNLEERYKWIVLRIDEF